MPARNRAGPCCPLPPPRPPPPRSAAVRLKPILPPGSVSRVVTPSVPKNSRPSPQILFCFLRVKYKHLRLAKTCKREWSGFTTKRSGGGDAVTGGSSVAGADWPAMRGIGCFPAPSRPRVPVFKPELQIAPSEQDGSVPSVGRRSSYFRTKRQFFGVCFPFFFGILMRNNTTHTLVL